MDKYINIPEQILGRTAKKKCEDGFVTPDVNDIVSVSETVAAQLRAGAGGRAVTNDEWDSNEFIDAKVLSIKDDNTLDVNIISKNENININMNNVTSLTPGMWTDGGCSNGEVFVDDDPTDPDISDPKTAQQKCETSDIPNTWKPGGICTDGVSTTFKECTSPKFDNKGVQTAASKGVWKTGKCTDGFPYKDKFNKTAKQQCEQKNVDNVWISEGTCSDRVTYEERPLQTAETQCNNAHDNKLLTTPCNDEINGFCNCFGSQIDDCGVCGGEGCMTIND